MMSYLKNDDCPGIDCCTANLSPWDGGKPQKCPPARSRDSLRQHGQPSELGFERLTT